VVVIHSYEGEEKNYETASSYDREDVSKDWERAIQKKLDGAQHERYKDEGNAPPQG
jgi:hypothetical protein